MSTPSIEAPTLSPSRHVLLLPHEVSLPASASGRRRKLIAASSTVLTADITNESLNVATLADLVRPKDLADALLAVRTGRKMLTVWLPRGWRDLVLSGMADLMDRKYLLWRTCVLDGEKCVITGRLSGLPVRITSFASFCGGSSADCIGAALEPSPDPAVESHMASVPADAQPAARLWLSLLPLPRLFEMRSEPLTLGSAARSVWASWMGPTARLPERKRGKKMRRLKASAKSILFPLPARQPAAKAAERHCCYGLFSEQFYQGHFGSPIYCWDGDAAYLQALTKARLPLWYDSYLHSPTIDDLRETVRNKWTMALVSVCSPDRPAPYRSEGKTCRAEGAFWTWACGMELHALLLADSVQECHGAHLYGGKTMSGHLRRAAAQIRDELRSRGLTIAANYWRGLYSALVGQFAQRSWEWIDHHHPSPSGAWATWSQWDSDLDISSRWRSIAGKCQRLEARPGSERGFPALFAGVTSWIRAKMDYICSKLPTGSVVARVCDSLWLTAEGHERMVRLMRRPLVRDLRMSLRERYDAAWLTGEGRAVIALDGQEYVRSPGVPKDSAINEGGNVCWTSCEPWTGRSRVGRADSVRVGVSTCSAARLKRMAGGEPRAVRPWRQFRDQPFREELLLRPVDPRLADVPAE